MRRAHYHANRLYNRNAKKEEWLIEEVIRISQEGSDVKLAKFKPLEAGEIEAEKTVNMHHENQSRPRKKNVISKSTNGKNFNKPQTTTFFHKTPNLGKISRDPYYYKPPSRKRGRDTYKKKRLEKQPNIRQMSLIMAAQIFNSWRLYRPFIEGV